MMTAAQPGLISALMPTPSQDVVLYKMTEAEAADKDQRRRIVNSEFTIFYGYDVDAVSFFSLHDMEASDDFCTFFLTNLKFQLANCQITMTEEDEELVGDVFPLGVV